LCIVRLPHYAVVWANESFRAWCRASGAEPPETGASLASAMDRFESLRGAVEQAAEGRAQRTHLQVRQRDGQLKHWVLDVHTAAAGELLLEMGELEQPSDDVKLAAVTRQVLAWVNHELRNPLNPISLTAAMLLYDEALPSAVRAGLEVIDRNAREESLLIGTSIELCRLAWGQLELPMELVDAGALMREAAAQLKREPQRGAVLLVDDAQGAGTTVRGDAARLTESLTRILAGLADAVGADGTVQLSRAEPHAGAWRMGLAGQGLDTETVTALCGRWENLGRRKDVLRLAHALAVLELHGGRLQLDRSAEGVAVLLNLPPVQAAPSTEPPPSSRPATDPIVPPMRVLVVEDDPSSRLILQRLLQREGHVVRVAGSIAEAREQLTAGPLDLVISDLGLPDGDGRVLLQQLKREAGVGVIALTGEEPAGDAEGVFDVHLSKPVAGGQLRRALAEAYRVLSEGGRRDRNR
jgi:hypothetical protein